MLALGLSCFMDISLKSLFRIQSYISRHLDRRYIFSELNFVLSIDDMSLYLRNKKDCKIFHLCCGRSSVYLPKGLLGIIHLCGIHAMHSFSLSSLI